MKKSILNDWEKAQWMKIVLTIWGVLIAQLAFPTYGQAQNVAQARFNCLSLRFQRATAAGLGQGYTLDLSSLSPQESPNGELYPLFDPFDYTHSSNFILRDPSSVDPVTGNLAIDVPSLTDLNDNQIPDFFETSLGVEPATTDGDYGTPVDEGTIKATWSRPAGSSQGTCRLQLTSSQLGPLPEYTAPFEILEYSGLLSYAPSISKVNATISLTNVQDNSATITGPAILAKVPTNGLIELHLASGHWTNAAGQSLAHVLSYLEPFPTNRSHYSGYVAFVDFDRNTPADDYFDWVLTIVDLNDSDKDGIPDLSDDPGTPPAQRPRLSLEIDRARETMLFRITGQTGRHAILESNEFLGSTNWTTLNTVQLTNELHLLQMPLPASNKMFYRLRIN